MGKVWFHCFVQYQKWYKSGKTCKRFQYAKSDINYSLKKQRQKTISDFFLSQYMRKHNTV